MMQFYATAGQSELTKYWPDTPTLLPASSYFRKGGFKRRPCLPEWVKIKAADCGGFVATRFWGDYRYTPDEYVTWLNRWTPNWAATMDYCCEREIAAGIVRERQQRTSEMAWRFWRDYRDASWAWVPTIQGWNVTEYVAHARELRLLILEMQRAGHPEFRVGIGTLCARKNALEARKIIWRVVEELPGVPIHLWGVKMDVFAGWTDRPAQIVSTDSGAWQRLFGHDIERVRAGARAVGKSRLRYTIEDVLPQYRAQLEALANPIKPPQLSLWNAA